MVISKKVVSPSGDLTIARVFVYSIIIALIVSFGIPYADRIYFYFNLSIESNAFEKSINISIAGTFFDFTPSIKRRMVNICPVVDRFVLNPFWFFLRIYSILGLILFNNIRLYIFEAIDVRVIPL